MIADFLHTLFEKDDEKAEATAAGFTTLPAVQASKVLEELIDLLSAPEVDTRWWATRAMAALSSPLVPAFLARALEDEHTSVRQCAALGLRMHPNVQTVPALVTAMADPDGLVARLASDALVHIGKAAVPALLEIMDTGTRSTRLEAVRALAHIDDQRSIPSLFAVLDEDSALMEHWAIEGLDRMGVGMMLFSPD